MLKVHFIRFILFCLSFTSAIGQTSSLITKAEIFAEKGNLRDAIQNYKAAIALEPSNRKANTGLGLIYSELLDNYVDAKPYLQTAMLQPVRDTAYDVIYALAKCYQFYEDYSRALSFYERLKGVVDLDGDSNFEKEVEKRKNDCLYAQKNANKPADPNIYFVNAGKNINTTLPEYVPVLTNKNTLLFTSKRQDNPKEELNPQDGKYFESMYSSELTTVGFSKTKNYLLPDKYTNPKMYNHHYAIVSASADGKTLYTFKDSKLYEIPLEQQGEKKSPSVKFSKFGRYENHAFVSRDGNTLLFTSDMDGGLGGTDIYSRTKNTDGTWGPPVNLGPTVNTAFNEDSPFLATDGTLYFASEGHPGYGNYDIYKSTLVAGQWGSPENLGPPINTSAADIFLVLDSAGANGYFSSGRLGGYGDMDIYKISFLDKLSKTCQTYDSSAMALSVEDTDTSDFKNNISLRLASNYNLISIQWSVNGEIENTTSLNLEKDYKKTGTFPVAVRIVAGCDTCLSPIVARLDLENIIRKIPPVRADINSLAGTSRLAACMPPGKNKDRKYRGNTPPESMASELTTDDIAALGLSNDKLLFDLNKSQLDDPSVNALKKTLEICSKYPDLGVIITGHTDSRGNSNLNSKLSLDRAQAVKKFLISKGLPKKRIVAVKGEGSSSLINDCGTGVDCPEEKHMQNRRVELTFVRIKTD